jgi:hypothetical protein
MGREWWHDRDTRIAAAGLGEAARGGATGAAARSRDGAVARPRAMTFAVGSGRCVRVLGKREWEWVVR